MRAFWCLSQNFGDALTYALIEKIIGKPPQWVETSDERKHVVGVGSVLNHSTASSVVWGAGIASMADGVNPQADVRLVRGPLSALRIVTCGGRPVSTFGDPALLCPKLYGASEKKHDIGFIPHYADQSHWPGIPGTHRINVFDPVEKVVAEISSCRAVISSSLHGLIVADAFGIPAGWIFSPRVGGDGTKFADHFLAVGGEVFNPLRWEIVANQTTIGIINSIPTRTVSFNADAILKSFPTELID